MKFHFKKSRFKESQCAKGGHSLNRDSIVFPKPTPHTSHPTRAHHLRTEVKQITIIRLSFILLTAANLALCSVAHFRWGLIYLQSAVVLFGLANGPIYAATFVWMEDFMVIDGVKGIVARYLGGSQASLTRLAAVPARHPYLLFLLQRFLELPD